MKPIVGLEFSKTRIRAVTVSRVLRRPLRRFDIPWSDGHIDDAVRLLRDNLGAVSAIGIGLGMELLFPKRIQLPPVSPSEKRRMISVEPERFFPVSTPLVVSVSESEDLVVAADASLVERWIAALESWAPVENIEGAASAFVRAARAGRLSDGLYRMPSAGSMHGYADIRNGKLFDARVTHSNVPDAQAHPVPDIREVPAEFVAAFGAALGVTESPDHMLVSEERLAQIRASRTRSLVLGCVLAAASIGIAFFSAAQSRERYLDRINSRITALKPRAAAAQALQGRIELMGLAANAAVNAQSTVDPLAVMAVLSRRLPRDAVVMTLRGSADDWQISGTAKDAAAIIPALDADPAVGNVRFLAGTSRFTEGRRTYETFSLGFNARPTVR